MPKIVCRRLAAVLFVLLLPAAVCVTPRAQEGQRPLRVAFPQVKGMSETAPDGTRHGLVVDYLTEIAKYTGWEYEYVDVDDGDALVEESIKGSYDLIGGTYYLPGMEEYYAYPDYNTGYSRAVLLARREDRSIRSNDLESMNGKTIGVYANAKENVRRLKEFLSINNISCTLREYSFEQLSADNNLYPYLEGGEVDLLLGNFVEMGSAFRVIASFDSQPFYIVTNLGNQEVLEGLNMALGRITDANPNFGAERYAANFSVRAADIQLTQAELAYISGRGAVTVAVPEDWHPFYCENSAADMHDGLIPDVLKEVAAFTGLQFSYVHTASYIDAIRLVARGEADVLGFFLDGEDTAARQGLALTAPYTSLANTLVRNKAATYPDDGLVGAIIEGRQLPSDVPAAQVHHYAAIGDALAAVNKGEIDFAYGLSAQMEQAIQRHYRSNLVPVTLVSGNSSVCFALARPVDPDLLTIFNKAINSIPVSAKEDLLGRNMVSIGATRFSLMDYIYANPIQSLSVLACFLLLLLAAVLLLAHARMKAAAIQNNLEKARAESRAKGEFLSRMSHEIRTPMNAVVGLADLTCMLEGVPDNVRQNLSKIRQSSQYLLSLINDILDMSRLDSGMLSIAREPFSLSQMLDNLHSMMESEAGRRGIAFTMGQSITHSDLMGDAIRLRQVLTNLLSNAFKFTPQGGKVLLQAQEAAQEGEGATFTFRVADTGPGIREEDQERIFDSFEQLGPSSSQSQGTGLGLAISSSIVRLMGGALCVESAPGKGSTFYFTITLPLGEPQRAQEAPADGALLEGAHILLAEDNDLNAEIAIQLLELQGATVCRAENGKLALDSFAASAPGEFQAILMDVQMPQMNGLEATRAIRALPRPDAARIPIVAMTANSFQEDVEAAQAAGMDGFVTKPLDVGYLYRVLHDLLHQA